MEYSILVSASRPSGASAKEVLDRTFGLPKRIARLAKRTWSLFRESHLALVGLGIVLVFAFVAVFAPVISPYPSDFEAPSADRFVVHKYSHALPSNRTYNPPALGPTTPGQSDKQGGMWLINSAQEGLVEMDFLRSVLNTTTPFQAGNTSITLDIERDLGLSPPPSLPLTATYYIVPGLGCSDRSTCLSLVGGPTVNTGAIAVFADRDFVVADPFTRSVIYRDRLDFTPTWTGEDPRSAGEMTVQPMERFSLIGPVGPYHYFYAANPSRVVIFEVTYVNAGSSTIPSGRVALDLNRSLSAPPFVYYNDFQVNDTDFYRGGSGEGIFLPLTNGTLEEITVFGRPRGWIPLALNGELATASGPMGWIVSSDYPYYAFVPLHSSSYVGLAVLDLGLTDVGSGRVVSATRLLSTYARPNPTWESVGTPKCYYVNRDVYAAFFDSADGSSGTTHILRINITAGKEVTQFRADFPGRIRGFFEIEQTLSKIFVSTEAGRIWQASTVYQPQRPELYAVAPSSTASVVAYAGALGGTLYGPALTPQELYGVWTDSPRNETTIFQLLGTIRTPLPPGTYPSGNTYLLGTDFRGRDILTLLFWGTRVAFIVGLFAALFAVGLGTLVGLVAGYFGKVVDTLLMRTTDIFLVLPFLPIVLILASILHPSIWIIIAVLGIIGWPGIARVIRAQVLSLKERPFIDAARVAGASDFRIVFSHIAPNVLPFSFLYMSLTVAGAIITEAILSFLGLGDITVISWGGILSDLLTLGGSLSYWWWLVPPGICITVLSLGFYLLGRGFDEIINPRLRRR